MESIQWQTTWNDSRYTFKFFVRETAVNTANNTSTISYELWAYYNGDPAYGVYNTTINQYWYVVFDGVTKGSGYWVGYDFRSKSSYKIANGSFTCPHNPDGSKTLICSAFADLNQGTNAPKGRASITTGSFKLTRINRGTISVFDGGVWRKSSAVWVYDGSAWRRAIGIWGYDGTAWRRSK